MDADEALQLIEELIQRQGGLPLNNLQKDIFQGAWEGKSYQEIGLKYPSVSLEYLIQDVGPKLWYRLTELISDELGEVVVVRKDHLREVIEQLNDRMGNSIAGSRMGASTIVSDSEAAQPLKDQQRSVSLVVRREWRQAQFFEEKLKQRVSLKMVLIPPGSLLMGSPNKELERNEDEGPQHRVTVPSFFMSAYPITQAQWKAVANLPEVNQHLDPSPSDFTGNQRPVENVSWFDAVEFCDRLSHHTKRPYRLPTEAEWEYACRAGTTTPFHFGETITTDLANYDGSFTYGSGSEGEYRRETTVVEKFKVANAFGLSDMHGNVWEWCLDHWHSTYKAAPVDGSAWIDPEAEADASRVLRGGSWVNEPGDCRSATRSNNYPSIRFINYGFRVVCSAPRTL